MPSVEGSERAPEMTLFLRSVIVFVQYVGPAPSAVLNRTWKVESENRLERG